MVIPLTSGTKTSAMNYFGLIWTICRFQDVHWIGPFFFQKPIQYSQNHNYFQTPPPSFSYSSCHSKNNLFALHHNPTNYQYPATGSTYILPHDPSLFHQFRQTKHPSTCAKNYTIKGKNSLFQKFTPIFKIAPLTIAPTGVKEITTDRCLAQTCQKVDKSTGKPIKLEIPPPLVTKFLIERSSKRPCQKEKEIIFTKTPQTKGK